MNGAVEAAIARANAVVEASASEITDPGNKPFTRQAPATSQAGFHIAIARVSSLSPNQFYSPVAAGSTLPPLHWNLLCTVIPFRSFRFTADDSAVFLMVIGSFVGFYS
jgi:hypothetical protein